MIAIIYDTEEDFDAASEAYENKYGGAPEKRTAPDGHEHEGKFFIMLKSTGPNKQLDFIEEGSTISHHGAESFES